MHQNVTLGGPIWFLVQFLVLAAIAVSLFMLVDGLRPRRRENAHDRGIIEPLWVYSGASALFLGLLLVVQFIEGIQLAAAMVAFATPFVLVLGMVYLLRVVFPKQPGSID